MNASIIEYYRKINNTNGLNRKQSELNYAKNNIIKDFTENLSSFSCNINNKITTDLLIYGSSNSNTINSKLNFMCKPNEFLTIGNAIKVLEWNTNWIVTKIDENQLISCQGKIEKCNNVIKFYDKTSILNAIVSVPCIKENKSMGIDDNKYFINVKGKITVKVPASDKTLQIYDGQRFIIDLYVYEVDEIKFVDLDLVKMSGYLEIEMSKVQEDERDNFDTGIAWNDDVIKNNYKINILSSDLSFAVSQTVRLSVQVTNNGEIVSNPNLTYTSSNTSIFTVNSSGLLTGVAIGIATISVSLTDEPTIMATTSININSTISDNYSIAINGSSSIIKKKQSVYSAIFYNNGVEIATEESIFYLTDVNGIALSTNIASIYSQDINGNCIVLAGNPSGVQYAYLHVKNASGSIISDGYKIKIYSLV